MNLESLKEMATMKNKPLDIVLLIFKIIIPLLLIVPFIFFTYLSIVNRIDYLEVIKLYGEPPGHYGMAEFMYALLTIFINVGVFVISAICLLTAFLFKSSKKRDKHIFYFSVMLFAPNVATILYCVILVLIFNIG